jgi:hypothetical protein
MKQEAAKWWWQPYPTTTLLLPASSFKFFLITDLGLGIEDILVLTEYVPVYRWTYVVGRDGATSGGCHTDALPGQFVTLLLCTTLLLPASSFKFFLITDLGLGIEDILVLTEYVKPYPSTGGPMS